MRDAALAVLLRAFLLAVVKDSRGRKTRISQVRHVEFAHRAVGAAETIQQHLLVLAVGHSAQLVLQQLDSLAVAGDGVISVLRLTHTMQRDLQLSQIHPLLEVVLRVHLRALHQELHDSTHHAQSTGNASSALPTSMSALAVVSITFMLSGSMFSACFR